MLFDIVEKSFNWTRRRASAPLSGALPRQEQRRVLFLSL
jgi:hypothetical protein